MGEAKWDQKKEGKEAQEWFDAVLLGAGSPEMHTTQAGAKFCLHNIPNVFLRWQGLF